MTPNMLYGMLAAPVLVSAQALTGTLVLTAADIATNNVTILEATQEATTPFHIYSPEFSTILGASPKLTLVVNSSIPAFHEAGIVTSLEPLTFYSSSNQFASAVASPESNNKIAVISRTTFSNTTGWATEIINANTAPLTLPNGGFQYQDGILWAAQGNLSLASGAALVYLPTNPAPTNTTPSVLVLNNYLGAPLNSPNDVYVTRNGVIYFTDPQIGFVQGIRNTPTLQNLIYGFVPNSTDIRVLANDVDFPNGITFSPDEKTAYVTEAGSAVSSGVLPAGKAIHAFDVKYASADGAAAPGEIASFTNRRVFAVPSDSIGDGIHCDSIGNVWVGTGSGVEVYSPAGRLLGKVLIDGGVANFGFASDGKLLLMAEKLLYKLQIDSSVQPAVPVGERRG